ncbi:formate dehydrogenase subunit delta [Bauldia sp.]|uniref:formate dehydrogenase subunit delta n=1 Tax=Bauldia sp. TaxID=2575872 RepID=UPI003BA9F5CA
MWLPKLVYMANQIGRFFVTADRATAVEGIADHLRRFWDPQMRAEIIAYVDQGGDDLDPPVREAVEALRDGQ